MATAQKKGIAGIRLSNPETLEDKTDAGHSFDLTQTSDTSTATLDFSDQEVIVLSEELSETLNIEIEDTEEQQ